MKEHRGFIDLQVNGFQGIDYSESGLTMEMVRGTVRALCQRGTLAFCPTIITSSLETYRQNLPVLAAAFREKDLAPHLLGIHLEGPFISREDGARGAHAVENTAAADPTLFDELLRLANGSISLVTLAPELPGALELIRHIRGCGPVVSLGHHLADRDTISRACDAGAASTTHLGNGLPNALPRHPNPIWDQLAEDRLTSMVITDGHHVPSALVKVAARAKGAEKFIAVSDASPIAGLPPGTYQTLGQEVVLEESGRTWNPVGNHLVGSSFSMFECMNYLSSLEIFDEPDLWRVGYENPLDLLGWPFDPALCSECPEVEFVEGRFRLT